MEPALGIRRCPLVQLALEVKYPPLSHIELGERRARVHRRPPSVQPCRVLTGPLRPVDGFPALHGGALLPRLLRILRHVPAATADGAPAPSPRARRAPPGRFPRSPQTGRQGRRPALPRRPRRALPQHGTRPRSSERVPDGRDGPEQVPGPSNLNSPQPPVSGLLPSLGASDTGSSPTPFCLATAPDPLAAGRCSIVRGCSRPPPHLWSRTAPQLHPTVTAVGGGSFHPTRSYGASWRTRASGDE